MYLQNFKNFRILNSSIYMQMHTYVHMYLEKIYGKNKNHQIKIIHSMCIKSVQKFSKLPNKNKILFYF